MTVALRAHHLLCVLTYVGEGYNADFVANYDRVLARLAAGGNKVRIVEGPDDICAPLCRANEEPHCLGSRAASRDRRAARELEPVLGIPITAGTHFLLDDARLARLRTAFATQDVRSACQGCSWSDLCTRVASRHYAEARL